MSRIRSTSVLLLPVLLFACGPGGEGKQAVGERYGGVFNFNETQVVRSLFPLQVKLVSEQRVASQVYEGLVRFDPSDFSILPCLAESWEVDAGRTVYTFRLREGVRFHDDPVFPGGKGRELTAADVVACFTAVCEKGMGDAAFAMFQDVVQDADDYHASGKSGGKVSGLQAVDDQTVRITLVRPTPNFLQRLAVVGLAIWPHELVEAHGNDLLRTAIGTGPFRMKVAREGEAILLERNPDYWGHDEEARPLPYLDAVRVTLVPEKEKEVAEFLAGRLSMMTELASERINVLADSIGEDGERRFHVRSSAALSVQFYGFNLSKPPFNDRRVRQAFAMALDRQRLVDEALHGMALPAMHGLVAPGLAGYPYERVQGIRYDPDSARLLLAQAGFPGGKGFPRVQLQVNSHGFGYRSVATMAQEMLGKELGVAVTVSVVPPSEYYDRIERGAALFWREGWVADLPDPENFLALLYGKNAVADTSQPSPFNTTRYANPGFDALYSGAMAQLDSTRRMNELAAAENLALRDVPLVPLYHERVMLLLAPKVQGLQVNSMELLDLRGVWFSRPGT